MTLKPLLDAFERTPAVLDLSERLPSRATALRLGGLPASSAAVLVAWLVRSFPQRLLTVVAPTPADAERWLSDLGHLTDAATVLYPQREALGEDEPHYEIAGERAETVQALLEGKLRILVTTARATAERTLLPAALERLRLSLSVGDKRPPADVARDLETMGYCRVPTVTEVAATSITGPALPTASTTDPAAMLSSTVPSEQPVISTVYELPLPAGVPRRQPVALPERVRSALDSPVSGGVHGARAGTLAVMVSGSRTEFDLAAPAFDAIGKAIFVGETPGIAQSMKLINNLLASILLEASVEALVSGVKVGLTLDTMISVRSAERWSAGGSPIWTGDTASAAASGACSARAGASCIVPCATKLGCR